MTIYIVHMYRQMKLRFDGVEADTPEAAAAIARGKPTGEADDIDDCDGEDFAALVDVAGDEEYEQSRTIDFEPERQRKNAPKLLEALKIAEGFVQWALDHGADDDAIAAALTFIRTIIAEAEISSIRPEPNGPPLLAALEAILPFAENEGHSLFECWRRDRDPQVKKYSDACASSIENAHATVAQAKAAGIASATTDVDNLIREHLQRQRQVAVIWCVADVKDVRPDLTDDQAWEVLQECRDQHDCEWGITWTFIKDVAANLFGKAPKPAESQGDGHESR
jgi:hypothetical protein